MKKSLLTEDWSAVVLGLGLIVIIAIVPSLFPPMRLSWTSHNDFLMLFSQKNITQWIVSGIVILGVGVCGSVLMRKDIRHIVGSLPLVFILAITAQIISSLQLMKNLGLETVLFSLLIGISVGFFPLPQWFRKGLSSEFFIKIGLVLLGSSVLFQEALKAGIWGMVQSVIVVFSVWYFSYWLSQRMKIDRKLSVMMASAVSICGVSAAIATAGAIKGDSKKLSYIISLVLIVALPMMIFMPILARYIGLSPEVTGAWLGGSIDTTGAVVASGTIAGDTALKFSTIVKFSQNVLLGVAAFIISLFWSYKQSLENSTQERPTLRILWQRFPKFVLGFIAVSLFFSFVMDTTTIKEVAPSIKYYRSLLFNLAFVCIGLETNLKDLFAIGKGKPLYASILAQLFNIIITLIVAYIIFGWIYPTTL